MMIITKHAEQRMKERCGIKRSSAARYADRAISRGIERNQTKGALRKWMDRKYESHPNGGGQIWMYGDKVFVTANDRVLTVLNLPTELKKYMKDYASVAGKVS